MGNRPHGSTLRWFALGLMMIVHAINYVDRQVISILNKAGVREQDPYAGS